MAASTLTHSACARYGLMGLPLAFVAMPLYVVLPSHYGQTLGVPLGLLGMVLLGTRLADAFIDPMIGRWVDRLLGRPSQARWTMALAALLLAMGFGALFFPPVRGTVGLLSWCAATLVITFAAYSVSSVLYLAWGTRLGGDVGQRSRLVAWREGCGLAGVVLANMLAVQSSMSWTTAALLLTLTVGVWALTTGPQPEAVASHRAREAQIPSDAQGLFLINGVASAIPATLVLFFIQDKLQALAWAPLFLGSYFLSAAASVPWWVKQMMHRGLMPSWALGMGLSVLAFVGVMLLGAGDTWAYWLVCVASGWALGADLTIPGTLLTGVVQRAGHGGLGEGAYAGWWQWATKLNLALAAGLALPALQAMGYSPGAREPQALLALTLAYGLMPCVFKLTSLLLCWRWRAHAALV
jgi:GPH family glycoside/pentoside/hexuronide:cation symporter